MLVLKCIFFQGQCSVFFEMVLKLIFVSSEEGKEKEDSE